jgi:hypothetical protein
MYVLENPARSDAEAYHVQMREVAGFLLILILAPPLIVAGLAFDAWVKLKERWRI